MTRYRWCSHLVYPLAAALLLVSCRPTGSEQTVSSTPAPPTPATTAEPTPEGKTDPEQLLRNGHRLGDGTLLGGQPTPEQLERISRLGYTTVINIRGVDEDGTTDAQVQQLGMAFVSIPIESADDLTEENARALAQALDVSQGPAVVHCASGTRVGALFALKAFYVDGMSAENALSFGKENGMTRLGPVIQEKLAAAE